MKQKNCKAIASVEPVQWRDFIFIRIIEKKNIIYMAKETSNSKKIILFYYLVVLSFTWMQVQYLSRNLYLLLDYRKQQVQDQSALLKFPPLQTSSQTTFSSVPSKKVPPHFLPTHSAYLSPITTRTALLFCLILGISI